MLHVALTVAISITGLLLSALPTVPSSIGIRSDGPRFPAPEGYLLPWEGGRIHTVTQGEETTFTHNGLAAYAFDFDLDYDTVVAARGGRVQFVRDESNAGGCSAVFSHASNYVVIDHGDGTSALYLHLAHASALVEPGQIIERGEPIAVSGETGVTCTGVPGDLSPAPHLHFQIQRYSETSYFSQSLPVTFDDVKDDGIPREGASYASGNYGPGKPQKIALTPRRVPRVFNPVARPADPTLLEVIEPAPEALPAAPESSQSTPPPVETPLEAPTEVPSETPTRTPTSTAAPTDTPTATPTPPPAQAPAPPPLPPENTPTPEAGAQDATIEPLSGSTPAPTPGG